MATSHKGKTPLSSSLAADEQIEPIMPRKKSTIPAWFSLAIILALIANGAAIYAIYANSKLGQQTAKSQELLTTIATIKQQQTQTAEKIAATDNRLDQANNELQDKLTALNNSLQTVAKQRVYQTKDWLLLKAQYCLELAQINAHWSSNLQTTAALMAQADELLAQIQDQRIFAVRQAIAKELSLIEATPKTDITGILSQLDAAQMLAIDLPLKKPVKHPSTDDSTSADETSSSAWGKRLQQNISLLEKLVVIRHHSSNAAIEPLPTPSEETILRESLRLNLQQAQWSVLKNNETLFQWLLTQSLKSVQRSFDTDNVSSQTLIKLLQGLQKVDLEQKNPPLDKSLQLLNQIIDSGNKPESPTDNKGENS